MCAATARPIDAVRQPVLPSRAAPRTRRAPTAINMLAPAAFAFTPVESGLAGLTLGLMAFAKLSITGR